MRQRWGCGGRCPARGLRENLVAEAAEKTLNLPPGTVEGCPFEGVYHPGVTGGHLGELLDARMLVHDEHLSWEDALGRPLTAADVDGIDSFKRAKARIAVIERREAERAAAARQRSEAGK